MKTGTGSVERPHGQRQDVRKATFRGSDFSELPPSNGDRLTLLPQLEFNATEPVRAALTRVGRTEDIRFSADGRLLVLAGFTNKLCLVLQVRIERTTDGPLITVDDFLELTSDGITMAHGVDFLDDSTIVVANRDGRVAIVPLPRGELGGRACYVEALQRIRSTLLCRVKAPGSVAVVREPNGPVAMLVSSTYINHVSLHLIESEPRYRVRKSRLLLERSLKVPDGLALSHDGQWIAVSGHHTYDVKMFARTRRLNRHTEPSGTLRDANFPHGLRFTADDQFLLVSDAGLPNIYVYARGDGWGGVHERERTVVVLSDEAFAMGRFNQEEGGPKGLDIDPSSAVVAVTCEAQTLAFFPLSAFTSGTPTG